MRVNQNSSRELDLYPEIDLTSSLLPQSRPYTYRKDIGPRNRVRNYSANMNQCRQDQKRDRRQNTDKKISLCPHSYFTEHLTDVFEKQLFEHKWN
jgi:hypothetical protein